MRQAKEEEQADIEEFDEDTVDKGDDTVRYAHSNNIVLYYFCGQILLYFWGLNIIYITLIINYQIYLDFQQLEKAINTG